MATPSYLEELVKLMRFDTDTQTADASAHTVLITNALAVVNDGPTVSQEDRFRSAVAALLLNVQPVVNNDVQPSPATTRVRSSRSSPRSTRSSTPS